MLFHEADWPLMLAALVRHIEGVQASSGLTHPATQPQATSHHDHPQKPAGFALSNPVPLTKWEAQRAKER